MPGLASWSETGRKARMGFFVYDLILVATSLCELRNIKYVIHIKGPSPMKELTVLEQIILAVIWNLEEGAYGVSVRQQVQKATGKKINYGTLYNALEQLLNKGYVKKTQGASPPDRIGRPRIYYRLTAEGGKALWEAYKLQTKIWKSIPDFVKNYKS
jgi:DNA-binding PadR family transcriptional regulator